MDIVRAYSFLLIYMLMNNCFVCAVSLVRDFTYGRAISNAKSGNLSQARDLLGELLANDDQDPEILYDLGVVSYQSKEYEQAQAYFQAASQYTHNKKLKEKALFNFGNVHVALKNYKKAIEAYGELLKDNPDNAYAKHNREKAEELLREQQKNQKRNEEDKNKNKENDGEKQKDESGHDQESDSLNDDNNQKNDSDEQSKNEQEKSSSAQNHDNQQSEKKQSDSDKKEGSDYEDKNDGKKEKDSSSSLDQKKQQDQDSMPDKQQEKRENQAAAIQKKEHDSAPDKNGKSSAEFFNENEQWMAQLLEKQEQNDAKMHRALLKGVINTAPHGGNDEMYNW